MEIPNREIVDHLRKVQKEFNEKFSKDGKHFAVYYSIIDENEYIMKCYLENVHDEYRRSKDENRRLTDENKKLIETLKELGSVKQSEVVGNIKYHTFESNPFKGCYDHLDHDESVLNHDGH